MLCKLDMEKAFDHVSWNFIDYMLDRLGFGGKWIQTCIFTSNFTAMVNGGPSSFFSASSSLRQGDPLSLLLFIIIMEALNQLIEKAKDLRLLRDICVGNFGKQMEVTHLFFTDDTLIFCQPDVNTLMLRCILLCFQVVFGLNINLNKSELVEIGNSVNGQLLAQVLDCKISQLLIMYLGIPLEAKYKDGRRWESIIDTVDNALACWKRNFLWKGGRLTLIKSTLSNLLIYYLYVLHNPTKLAKKLESIQNRFLWGDEDNRKFHLVK